MDKYALLIRLNPKYWPTWDRHILPGQDCHVWFETGRRIPEELHSGLPVVVLGTGGKGILAMGETTSNVEFRGDPDWAEAPASEQAECKEPRNRVRIRIQGLTVPVPAKDLEANATVARLPRARETITWLKSDEYSTLISLVHSQNG